MIRGKTDLMIRTLAILAANVSALLGMNEEASLEYGEAFFDQAIKDYPWIITDTIVSSAMMKAYVIVMLKHELSRLEAK